MPPVLSPGFFGGLLDRRVLREAQQRAERRDVRGLLGDRDLPLDLGTLIRHKPGILQDILQIFAEEKLLFFPAAGRSSTSSL